MPGRDPRHDSLDSAPHGQRPAAYPPESDWSRAEMWVVNTLRDTVTKLDEMNECIVQIKIQQEGMRVKVLAVVAIASATASAIITWLLQHVRF